MIIYGSLAYWFTIYQSTCFSFQISSYTSHCISVPSCFSEKKIWKTKSRKAPIGLNRNSLNNPKYVPHRSNKNTDVLLSASLIHRDDAWRNIATLAAVATFSQQKFVSKNLIGKLLAPPVTAMVIAFLLGSIRILPIGGSPSTKNLQLISLQLATPLLMLGADVKGCRTKCAPLLKAFILTFFATLIDSSVALSIPALRHLLTSSLGGGKDGLIIAAALMAKNIGGGVNYVAVCTTLGSSPNAIVAGLCVDIIFSLIYFPFISALSNGLPDATLVDEAREGLEIPTVYDETGVQMSKEPPSTAITVNQISTTFSLAAIMTWLGEKIGGTKAALPVSTFLTLLLTTMTPYIESLH